LFSDATPFAGIEQDVRRIWLLSSDATPFAGIEQDVRRI
jgi:hypothetical protein